MNKGITFMFFATIFFMLVKIFVKMLPHIPPMEIVFFRCIISFLITYYLLKRNEHNIFGTNRSLLMLRGIFGTIGLYCYFVILQEIPLATASTLIYFTPLLTSLVGVFILKEKMSTIQWILLFVAFFGIILIQGFDSRVNIFYLLIGLGGSLCAAFAYSIIRYLRDKEHSLVLMIYFPMIAFPIGGLISIFNWVQPNLIDLFLLILIGVFTQFAQYFMTKAFQSEKVSKVSIVSYSELVFVLLIGNIFFDEKFNFLVYLGMILVTFGVVFNILLGRDDKKYI
ncbi:MAG: DMT family transporter [Flammeovirgaceae bacterium TMED290]|nr:MAG: DMT family transporter [Flammeovirgaceae bacterium TMED290]